MPEYLTYDRALVLLREVVAEFGEDYRYPDYPPETIQDPDLGPLVSQCFYVRDAGPSCIVARVFHRAGVPIEDLRGVEAWTPVDVRQRPQFARWADQAARRLLFEVQDRQDAGQEWGRALAGALAEIEGNGS